MSNSSSQRVAAALVALAEQRGGRVALRRKERGVWRAWTWRDVATEVERLLFAQVSDREARSPFAFLAAQAPAAARAMMLGSEGSPEALSTLKVLAGEPGSRENSLLFAQAEDRVQQFGIGAEDHVVLGPELDGDERAGLLFEWLSAGFTLYVAEHPASILGDTREVGPTYLASSAQRYAEFWREVSPRLGAPGSRRRRLVDWALARPGNLAAQLLVLWPLRRNLGLARVRQAVIVGGELPPAIEKELRAILPTLRAGSEDPATPHHVSGAYPVAAIEVDLRSAGGSK